MRHQRFLSLVHRHFGRSAIVAALAGIPLLGTLRAEETEMTSHTLLFSTDAPGEKSRLTRWGVDTAWANPDNVRRSVLYMGKDYVDVVRVSFPADTALVNGDLPPSKLEHFQTRLELAKLAGDKPFTMLPDSDRGVHPWFKNGKQVIPERWVRLMAVAQRHYGKKMESVEPFNEADWGWGQGTVGDLKAIMAALRKSPDFAGAQIAGPSTLNADAADGWYEPLKQYLDRGTTHVLAGTFPNYANFYTKVVADGKIADQPEAHNLVDVIAGAEYGVQQAIWWGAAERARGEFVKASHGVRLAYAEDRPRWSAAAVYRAPSGKLQAFLGSAERHGKAAEYQFVCRDRDVFFNGDGPRRDFSMTINREAEDFVNITWGQDVPPVIAGTYAIVNRQSGKVLGVVGADQNNGAAIQQMDYTRAGNQQWEIAPISTRGGDQSYVTLRAVHSGRTLDMTDWSYQEGAKVQQWGEGEAGAQQWFLDYAGDNCFYIRSRWSAKCLDVADGSADAGAAIVQASPAGALHQQWRLVPAKVWPIDLEAPQTPAGLAASARPLAVELKWQPNPEADLAGYTVFRSTTAGGPYDTIARGVSGNCFIDNQAREQRKYYYVIKAVDQSLNQSALSAEVAGTPVGGKALAASYPFSGDACDTSGNANHADLQGSPAYAVGRGGERALVLDGKHDYLRLPVGLVDSEEITVSAWVYPQGNTPWGRIFDLGNDESHFLMLTPSSGGGTLRLAAKNGDDEQAIEAPGLPGNQWSHVAVTLSGKAARLYMNGKLVASSDAWTIKPSDIKAIFNYVGKSQFAADPLLQGKISNLRIYNYAITSDEVAALSQ